jgi:hypothetical protein
MLINHLPETFAESVSKVEECALFQTQKSAKQHQYYHNEAHIQAVKRRAGVIFEAIAPFLSLDETALQRTQLLIDLCAYALTGNICYFSGDLLQEA